MVTWMLMLLHVDIACRQEGENSSCTFQYMDVLKFKTKISRIMILTISKIKFLWFIDTEYSLIWNIASP